MVLLCGEAVVVVVFGLVWFDVAGWFEGAGAGGDAAGGAAHAARRKLQRRLQRQLPAVQESGSIGSNTIVRPRRQPHSIGQSALC